MALVFYFYVSERLTNENRRMFDHFVREALNSDARWDPGALQTMIHGPARLLKAGGAPR